ncbi:MAG TPA: hypothetical protein VMT20_22645 [Terriglobia bacterium]|nr:hypothetical protein [Terriglobia bacterium]
MPESYQNETVVDRTKRSPEIDRFESVSSHGPRPRLELAICLPLLIAPFLKAADLKSETLRAWDAYVGQAQARAEERVSGQSPFLWVDGNPKLIERVRAGEVVAEPEGGESPHAVPHGLIHDWVGAVFVPNAKLDDVTSVLNEYEHYKEFYWPMVAESSLLEDAPYRESVRLLMVQRAYSVTAAVEADDAIQMVRLDADRAYILSASLCVHAIADYGKAGAHALPEDHGPGYVWRTFTVTRLEQRDGGTYVEMEMIALSRGIPWEFRWLMQPLAERLPRNLVAAMVSDTRTAVNQERAAASLKGAVAAQSFARDDPNKSQPGGVLARSNR